MFPTIIYHIPMICEAQLINSQNLLWNKGKTKYFLAYKMLI